MIILSSFTCLHVIPNPNLNQKKKKIPLSKKFDILIIYWFLVSMQLYHTSTIKVVHMSKAIRKLCVKNILTFKMKCSVKVKWNPFRIILWQGFSKWCHRSLDQHEDSIPLILTMLDIAICSRWNGSGHIWCLSHHRGAGLWLHWCTDSHWGKLSGSKWSFRTLFLSVIQLIIILNGIFFPCSKCQSLLVVMMPRGRNIWAEWQKNL